MNQKKAPKLQIRERRVFSLALKKKVVGDLLGRRTSIRQIMAEHQVSSTSVYKWLYKYSPHHEPKCTLVVQMKSESAKNAELLKRLGELERIIGQKQLEIDYLNKLLEISSSELGFDVKKSFSPPPSAGSTGIKGNMDTS
jgi:transposase